MGVSRGNFAAQHALEHALKRPQLPTCVVGMVERRPLVAHEYDSPHYRVVLDKFVLSSQFLMREQRGEAEEIVERDQPHRILHLERGARRPCPRHRERGGLLPGGNWRRRRCIIVTAQWHPGSSLEVVGKMSRAVVGLFIILTMIIVGGSCRRDLVAPRRHGQNAALRLRIFIAVVHRNVIAACHVILLEGLRILFFSCETPARASGGSLETSSGVVADVVYGATGGEEARRLGGVARTARKIA